MRQDIKEMQDQEKQYAEKKRPRSAKRENKRKRGSNDWLEYDKELERKRKEQV